MPSNDVDLTISLCDVGNRFYYFASDFGKAMDSSFVSLIVVTGTLVAMISLRNGHLSDRARGNVSEAVATALAAKIDDDKDVQAVRRSRLANLHEQNAEFIPRYKRTAQAFRYLGVSILLLLASRVVGTQGYAFVAGICSMFYLLFVFVGIFIFTEEFRSGMRTLVLNEKILDEIKNNYDRQ